MRDHQLTELPFLRCVGLILTRRCQVSCPHCILESGPHRSEEIATNQAIHWIEQIAAYRSGYVKAIALSGGEPFIDLPKLRTLASFASELGLFVSVVTNGFWATSEDVAESTLKSVSGIQALSVSCDIYHLAAIPFVRVQNAIRAAREVGVPCTAAICTQRFDDPGFKRLLESLSAMMDPGSIDVALAFPVGRGNSLFRQEDYDEVPDPPQSACPVGSSPIIFPDGRVTACIGPVIGVIHDNPLILGNLYRQTISEIFDRAETNAVLHAIRVWGPRRIIERLKAVSPHVELPGPYVKNSACHACHQLMLDPRIAPILNSWNSDTEFIRRVLYGRAYYLGECTPEIEWPGSPDRA